MGIIGFFKGIIAFRKMMKELPAQLEQQKDLNLNLSTEELAALSDEDLYYVALDRAETALDSHEEFSDGFASLSEPQRVLMLLNNLEAEVNNGGLCQFFVNSTREMAPYVSKSLEAIGAVEHLELFDGFISRNQIDLQDLSSFVIHRVKDFEKQTKRYPFDEYDDRFYELPSLEEPLTAYIRAHIESF